MRSRCSGHDPTCGRLFRLQLTSQDHTPKVIRRALEKHNMEHVSCHDFSLCQMLNNGKGISLPLWPPFAQCECRIYLPLVLVIKHRTAEQYWQLTMSWMKWKSNMSVVKAWLSAHWVNMYTNVSIAEKVSASCLHCGRFLWGHHV